MPFTPLSDYLVPTPVRESDVSWAELVLEKAVEIIPPYDTEVIRYGWLKLLGDTRRLEYFIFNYFLTNQNNADIALKSMLFDYPMSFDSTLELRIISAKEKVDVLFVTEVEPELYAEAVLFYMCFGDEARGILSWFEHGDEYDWMALGAAIFDGVPSRIVRDTTSNDIDIEMTKSLIEGSD